MSEHEHIDSPEGDALESNIERLLGAAGEGPRVPEDARARMLAALIDARREAPASDESDESEHDERDADDRRRPDAGAGTSPPIRLSSRRARVVTGLVALAAAVLIAWLLGLGARLLPGDDTSAPIARFEALELGARAVELADGTRALLRHGTTLEQLAPRHLRLIAGEIVLDVREAAEPLVVDTPQGRARVTGTRVLVRSDASETLAAVLRGRARVESLGVDDDALLRAGEQALLRPQTAPERIAGRRLSFEIDWARELLEAEPDHRPARRGNLLARVPRWTGQRQPSAEWPLPVRALEVDVHIEDGHVRTTIDQTFFNHVERDLEGIYRFPLPPAAAISRLAMYVDGQRMEAGVVARDRGREIYEQIVHRRRDPALLEWMQGNSFQVRIFPLPARTEKRVLLSYTAALDELYGRGQLRVPIPELDAPVARVNYRIRVVGGAKQRFSARHHDFELSREGDDLIATFSAVDHEIGADIVAQLDDAEQASAAVERHELHHEDGRLHLGLRLRPDIQGWVRAWVQAQDLDPGSAPARDWVVLFDSSASRGPAELDAQRRFVLGLLEQLDDDDRLSVLAFDTTQRWLTPALTRVAELDGEAIAASLDRIQVGVGATDLGAAIDAGLERLAAAPEPTAGPAEPDGRERVPTLLYLGDGLAQDLQAPAGAADPGARAEALGQRFAGRAAFVGVSFGPAYDTATLARLAALGDGLHVHLDEGEDVSWRALELLATLATPRILDLDATLVDASGEALAPARTHASARSLAAGETLEILAELGPDAPEPVAVELRGRVGQQAWHERVVLPAAPGEPSGWLPRAWAQAHVAALSEAGVEANADEITKLGLAHFLVTPTTSLLVLESERMYQNFDVHRPSEQAWARYPAPDRIEVVREGAATVAGHGQYVVRTPLEVLVDPTRGWDASVRTRGFGPMMPLASAGSSGLGIDGLGLGLGIVGSGRGGGGFGFGLGGELRNLGPAVAKAVESKGESFGARRARERSDNSPSFGGFVTRELQASKWSTHSWANPQEVFAQVEVPDLARFAANVFEDDSRGYAGSQPWPRALHYAGDWHLDDLGELCPALFEDAFDLAREQLLLTGLDGTRGTITDEARELIERARAAQGDVRYALPEGGTLDIDSRGRFALVRERWAFLDEIVSYDGERLRADYPELGLSVSRAVGPTSPALLSQWVPWMVPPAEHLAEFYVVERSGPLRLRLTPAASQGEDQDGAGPSLEVELDADHRVVSLRVHDGERVRSTTEFRWTDAGVVVIADGREHTLERLGSARSIPELGAAQTTEINLPLPSPADLELALADHTPGDGAWIELQHQRLAGYAALATTHEQLAILEALREHAGRVLSGELTLAGAALHGADPKRRAAILAAAEPGPITELLRASLKGRGGAALLAKLAAREQLRGTPVGFSASYRTILRDSERRPNDATLRRLEAFLDDYRHPTYAYVASSQLANRWWSSYRRRADAWLALAEHDGPYRYVALHQAGTTLYQYGESAEASAIFVRAFDEAAADAAVPIVDGSVQWAMTVALGEAGWQLAWARLRERVASSGDVGLVLDFIRAAQRVGRIDDVQRVLAALAPAADELEPHAALLVHDQLLAHDRVREAAMVLGALRHREDLRESAPVLLRASVLAERQGRLDDAAVALERALRVALDGQGMDLDALRAGFARLFELRARLAQPQMLAGSTPTTQSPALRQALEVADRWRLEDPDNLEIDRLCADLLWSLGLDEEAWRQLSSTIDRHGAEGEALAWLADALERGGDLERADSVWARAIAVEPTDPIHRLRRAQSLLAVGRDEEAATLLDEITTGEWQPRFAQTVNRAKRLEALF